MATLNREKVIVQAVEAALGNPVIDLSIDSSKRPLAGTDADRFRGRHELQTVDAIYALCIQNSAAYNKVVRQSCLPYEMEMLIRLYEMHPGHSPWKVIDPKQAFTILYGDVAEQFRGTEYEEEARLALYRRFTAACGRSIYTAYRWMESEGNCKRGIAKIFAKLSMLDNPRVVLETLARNMYRFRGVSFDDFCPMPTIENPPLPRPRGPAPRGQSRPVPKSPLLVQPPIPFQTDTKIEKVVKSLVKKPGSAVTQRKKALAKA